MQELTRIDQIYHNIHISRITHTQDQPLSVSPKEIDNPRLFQRLIRNWTAMRGASVINLRYEPIVDTYRVKSRSGGREVSANEDASITSS